MSDYDKMRQSDLLDDDALDDDDIIISENNSRRTARDDYFDFYDDIKTSIKEDW